MRLKRKARVTQDRDPNDFHTNLGNICRILHV